ncbi:late secretory pathway protein AVL9 homolog [Microplitis demolitor]|uniref:late secretory pathway protein AVL9 homolog n=1 Tax=Microplitis demolitor TaxID=69319 RepID=UPI0004CD125D|nr:late secretory pathway protein AVL9 homolog [Microplitis demolitor]
MAESTGPILHVIVVGFHHKKGCQVEYSFPPLVPGAPNECPLGWKYLPTLALPDGSHNYDEDTVYFHLPSITDPKKTVYGVSCFRQIPVEKLINRTSDMTRGTVQKSVCVLSTLPLYGHIQVKMQLITHAYFDEGDFSKVSLLEDTFRHLNACMSGDSQIPPQVFVGLSARDFIIQFRHKALLLFKLLLLERKVVFYQSPVQPLCAAILTLLSLHPGMIESGLRRAACVRPSRPMSPIPNFDEDDEVSHTDKNLISSINVEITNSDCIDVDQSDRTNENSVRVDNKNRVESMEIEKKYIDDTIDNSSLSMKNNNQVDNLNSKIIDVNSTSEFNDGYNNDEETNGSKDLSKLTENVHRVQSSNTINFTMGENDGILPRDTSNDALSEARVTSNITQLAHVNPELCGLPLNIFTKGYLCLPYLSLPYLDLLGDVNVRGYIVGATNVLFKQKKQLIDVLIEVESARIEATDPELRRQLHLTTEDLRFADYVVRHVAEPRRDVFLDGVGWEGGDEWIRTQFRVYLLSLLRTSMQSDTRQSDHFNGAFVAAWKMTNNYSQWCDSVYPEINNVEPGHPFAGQLSVQDMKLRFSHTMQNTESGRKINQAMATTGRAVATTGKAVGGALSQAKGAFSNWWSTLTTIQPGEVEIRNDNVNQSNITSDDNDSENKKESNNDVTKELDTPISSTGTTVVVD